MADGRRRRFRKLLAAALPAGALALSACGGGGGGEDAGVAAPRSTTAPAATPPPVPALCGRLGVRVAGNVAAAAATELSGLVLSRTQSGVLWTHNDSGDRPRVLAISTSGRLLADVTVTGAQADDWEDIAAARGTLLIGDIGDNQAKRPSISVYSVAEPRISAGATASAPATRYELRYPDGPRDAEALLRDPRGGALVVVEKRYGGRNGVYVVARPTAGAPVTMRRAGGMQLGVGEAVTAGDVSSDGSTIVLRTYHRAYVWRRGASESVADALLRRPCATRGVLPEGQAEALAVSADGRAFYTVSEGPMPPLRRYAPVG